LRAWSPIGKVFTQEAAALICFDQKAGYRPWQLCKFAETQAFHTHSLFPEKHIYVRTEPYRMQEVSVVPGIPRQAIA
jgi:hypothetical protein